MRRPVLIVLSLAILAGPVAPAAALPAVAPSVAVAPAPATDTWPGRLEVALTAGAGAAGAALAAVPGVVAATAAFPGATDGELARWLAVDVAPGAEAAVADRLRGIPGVAAVAPTPLRVPAYEPNDPQRRAQWHLDRIGAGRGWAVARGARAVRLGVIDTGFDSGHTELRGVLHRRDGRPGVEALDSGCRPEIPGSDHGTWVAGLAAAATDNATGVSSVGFATGVVAVQAGVELQGRCVISPRWSRSLVELADAGVPVVNLSFTGTAPSGTETAAIRYATNRGTLVVAAAGNEGTTSPRYPAADPLVLGVAATDSQDRLWSRSNRGAWVDVAAPGVSLLTTCPSGYCHVTGTSAAAPVVAGIATLLAAARPDLSGLQLRSRVVDAALEITGRPLDPAIGHGRVRLDRTLLQRSVRLHGPDRLATSTAVSREATPRGGPGRIDRVVVVPADAPGDRGWTVTLPAAGLLADDRTALVMTARDRLTPAAAAEVVRLLDGRGDVVLPGDAASGVGGAVEDALRRAGHRVERIGARDAAATAAALAAEVVRGTGTSAALVARSDTFADALSLAGPAAARGYPLVFVGSSEVPEATCTWLRQHRGIRTLHLAGGTAAIGSEVEDDLRACASDLLGTRSLTITRDAGASRVETAVAVARRHFGPVPGGGVVVANGFRWPDAVGGGALAAALDGPVLLTGGQGPIEAPVRSYLAGGRVREAFVLGGPAVVSEATRAGVEAVVAP